LPSVSAGPRIFFAYRVSHRGRGKLRGKAREKRDGDFNANATPLGKMLASLICVQHTSNKK